MGGFRTVGTAEASAGWPVSESPGLFSVVRGKGYSWGGGGMERGITEPGMLVE